MDDRAWIELGTFVLGIGTVIGTGIWKLGSVRDEIKKDFEEKLDAARREVGETVSAMREKITQVELYIRDKYVTKETFNIVLERILAEIKGIGEKMETNKLGFENKFEKLRDLLQGRAEGS